MTATFLTVSFVSALLSINLCHASFSNHHKHENDVFKHHAMSKNGNMAKIGVDGKWMVDQHGRVRMFHGWNSVFKGFPWYDKAMLNETKLQFYKDCGFNVVRLGCMWSGFEPSENNWNKTYISIMKDIVNRLDSYGIYVILDMHQDVLTSLYNISYDGVPLWLVKKFPTPPHPYPSPLKKISSWSDGYLSQAVGLLYQNLYDNYAGSMDSMTKFWGRIAELFKDNSNVLGYELINEPWVGDIYSNPTLLEPGIAGRINLAPAYNKINSEIRKYDQTTLLFYEPVTYGVVMNGTRAGTGFDTVPGGPSATNTSVLSYHYYCWILGGFIVHTPMPFLQKLICDKIIGPHVFTTVDEDVKHTGGSSFLTEFGNCEPDGNPNSTTTVECDFIMRKADEYFASWTYWDEAFYDRDGHVQWNVTKPFVRIYPRAISGVPLMIKYNVTDHKCQFEYTPDLNIKQPTELIIPKLHYPNGFNVETTKGIKWNFDEDNRILKINANNNKFRNMSNLVISVIITKK